MLFHHIGLVLEKGWQPNRLRWKNLRLFLALIFVILVGCDSEKKPVLESCVNHENGEIHAHVSLVPVLYRQPQILPAGIGISDDCMKPLHTHLDDFIIHIEYSESYQFTMGDFFEVWADNNPYKDAKILSISLNGEKYDGRYEDLILVDGQNIVLEFGN